MSDVQVTFGADLRELQAKAQEAGKLVDNFQKGFGRAAGAANKLAGMIQLIGGASNSAASMAGNLLAGFALGGPMGLAVAGVSTLVSVIKQAREEEERAKKAAEEYTKALEAQSAAVRKRGEASSDRTRDAQTELALLRATTEAEKVQIQGAEKVRKINEQIADLRVAVLRKPGEKEGMSAAQRDTLIRRLEAERDATRQLTSALYSEARIKDQIASLNKAQGLPSIEGLRTTVGSSTAASDARTRALAAGYMPGGSGMQTAGAGADAFLASSGKAFDEQAREDLRLYEDELQRAKEQADQLRDAAMSVGDAFSTAFEQAATGSRSSGEIMKGVVRSILQAVLKLATSQIMANAATAATGAASSQAGIPVVGPVLAVAAMSSMFGVVMGFLDKLPSAAGGWDIPKGINPVTQLHSGEMVLPERIADQIRSGGMGGGLTLNVTTPDAESFYSMLKNRDSELIRVLREAAQDRRF